MYFKLVESQVLSTQGQPDVNLHRLTAEHEPELARAGAEELGDEAEHDAHRRTRDLRRLRRVLCVPGTRDVGEGQAGAWGRNTCQLRVIYVSATC